MRGPVERISESELRIFTRVSYKCYNQTGFVDDKKLWYSSLANFTFSVKNMLTVIGCYDYGLIEGAYGVNFSGGCIGLGSEAQDVPDGQCSGKGCCQISITKGLKYYDVTLGTFPNRTSVWSFNKCAYAFLAEEGTFKIHGDRDLKNHLKFVDRTQSTVPVVLDWVIAPRTNCLPTNVCKGNSSCYNVDGGGYRCRCNKGYEGNPYLDQGCQGLIMAKYKTLESYFKRKSEDASGIANNENKRSRVSTDEPDQTQPHDEPRQHQNQPEARISETHKQTTEETGSGDLERDPAKRKAMWDYSVNEREQVRRAYLHLGPYQIHLKEYPAKDAFTVNGFDKWKKVNDGKRCAFLKHIGCSQHKDMVAFRENLLNQTTHIGNMLEKQSTELVTKNHIRLKDSVDIVRWLVFQACAFRSNDESSNSRNRGNFVRLLKLLASYNDELANLVLDNAPYNSKYTSGKIQKEILGIIAKEVRKRIQTEVGDSYFCVMVDESRDESKRSKWLYKLCGQGYDGASNMRGEWNGLQALVCKDCPYAYYVHCFAHRLQLALVAVSREVIPVHQFFTRLTFTINVVCASSKRHDELQKAKASETTQLLELGENKKGKGKNQVGTLRRACDTRWGSHFFSVCSMLKMFDATRVVLKGIMDDVSSCYA
ncbi:zinc finger MYM-type protein 1-like protein [Tanacetum coccineum]